MILFKWEVQQGVCQITKNVTRLSNAVDRCVQVTHAIVTYPSIAMDELYFKNRFELHGIINGGVEPLMTSSWNLQREARNLSTI